MWFKLSLWHLARHWRLNLLLLLTLLVTTSLLAGLPLYAAAIADRSLRQTLAEATPSSRHILATGNLDVRLAQAIPDALGDLYNRRVRYRTTDETELEPRIRHADGTVREVPEFLRLRFFAVDELHNHVRILEGRLPAFVPRTNPLRLPTQEVAIGRAAADAYGLRLGDVVTSQDGGVSARVVGIVEPLDPADSFWFEDLLLFEMTRIPGGNLPDTIVLSLILPPQAITTYFRPGESWRVFTNWETITLASAAPVQETLSALLASQSGVQLSTGLLLIIEDYQARLATARLALFLLSAQSFLFALFLLTMVAEALLEQSQRELGTLFARGFAPGQITALFGAQFGLLALVVAAPLGPLVARALLGLWPAGGEHLPLSASQGLAWQLSFAAGTVAGLVLTGAVYLGVRGGYRAWESGRARPDRRSRWTRAGLDLFLLVLGGLAYWQLNRGGSLIVSAGADTAVDPLLLLGPTVLLVAVALFLLRLIPPLAGLLAWLWQPGRTLVAPLGLTRLARDPGGPTRVALLVSLTAALTLFAGALADTVRAREAAFAHFFNGADLRLALAADLETATAQQAEVAALPGVAGTAMAFRTRVRSPDDQSSRVALLAVDANAFAAVTRFPAAITRLAIADVMEVLSPTPGRVLPAVFSAAVGPADKAIGDQFVYRIGTESIAVEVRGIVRNFPSLSRAWAADAFILVNRPVLEQTVDLARLGGIFERQRELWVAVAPGREADVMTALPAGVGVLGTASQQVSAFRSSLVSQETTGAFDLNALTLTGLSVIAFVLVHALAAMRRLGEFGVLRALGLSRGQLIGLISLEGLSTVGLGLAGGMLIGLGLTNVLRPFLLLALEDAVGGGFQHAIVVDWRATLAQLGLLAALYAGALMAIVAGALRAGIDRVTRLGDE